MIIVAPVADTHPNSKAGLMPPEFTLEAGREPITVRASHIQRVQWREWCQHWQDLGELKVKHDAQLYAVINGDGSDDNTHAKAGLITTNPADVLKLGVAVLRPVRKYADKIFIVRGTEAHTGSHCWMEEAIAQAIEAEPDEEAQTYSWWYLPAEWGDVKFHIAHHPPTRGYLPHTRHSAPERCSYWLSSVYHETGDRVPDVGIYGHLHFYSDSGTGHKPRVWFLPSWQLLTPFVLRLGKAGEVPQLGGIWFMCEGGKYGWDRNIKRVRRKKAWTS